MTSELLAAAHAAADSLTASAASAASAVGFWADDLDDPGILALVYRGQLVYLGISDGWRSAPVDRLQDVVNACISNAFAMWHASTGTRGLDAASS
ncbi:hypothetical protein [Tsukamurella soli]